MLFVFRIARNKRSWSMAGKVVSHIKGHPVQISISFVKIYICAYFLLIITFFYIFIRLIQACEQIRTILLRSIDQIKVDKTCREFLNLWLVLLWRVAYCTWKYGRIIIKRLSMHTYLLKVKVNISRLVITPFPWWSLYSFTFSSVIIWWRPLLRMSISHVVQLGATRPQLVCKLLLYIFEIHRIIRLNLK